MFHVRYRAPYLSIDAFSHFRVDDIFAVVRGPYRIQHSGDKPIVIIVIINNNKIVIIIIVIYIALILYNIQERLKSSIYIYN